MNTVLVTGGRGILGQQIVSRLPQEITTILSRAPGEPVGSGQITADLRTDTTLTKKLAGIDVVVHAASNPTSPDDDLVAARNLLEAAKAAKVRHFIFISIVGVDVAQLPYYGVKLHIENLVKASGIPFTIVRATQFHDFAVFLLSQMVRGPLFIVPSGATLQPVEIGAVAQRIAELALEPPTNGLVNLAGPDILSVDQMAADWLKASHRKALRLSLPLSFALVKPLVKRQLILPSAEAVGESWSSWIKRYSDAGNPYLLRGVLIGK